MYKYQFILLFFFLPIKSFPQQGFHQAQNLKVTKDGVLLKNAWAGGVNAPQLSPIDLNNNGIMDLMVFDRNGNQLNCFTNNGTYGTIDYNYEPEYNQKFPELNDWVLLRDYNCDGKNDIFTSHNGAINVYKNTSIGSELRFTFTGTILTDRGFGTTNLYVGSVDIPHIGDIDYDGDLDVLTFNIMGDQVEWHKNESMETYGTCDSLYFKLEDRCWGNFSENFSDNSISLNHCSEMRLNNSNRSGMHSGSTLTAIDLTGNSSYDLLIGDVSYNNVVMLKNEGNLENALMVELDDAYPNNSESIDLQKFPASFYFDVDNDNRKDLIVSPNSNRGLQDLKNIWFYKNNSNNTAVNLELVSKNAIVDEMIDVGTAAHPVFFDYNDDGLMDLIISNEHFMNDEGGLSSQLTLYKNTGSKHQPEFEWVSNDYAQLGNLNIKQNLRPTFGDLNNDGNHDMLVGNSEGKIHYFDNIPYNEVSDFFLSEYNYANIDVGSYASPYLFDLDEDDDLDLLIGNRQGKIIHYENKGTVFEPNFVLVNETFGNIDLSDSTYKTGYTTPIVVKHHQDFELYVGTEKGKVHHYTGIKNNLFDTFNEIQDTTLLYSKVKRVAPAIYDLNKDGSNDMLLGIYTGGVHLLWGSPFQEIQTNQLDIQPLSIQPNPSRGNIHLKYGEKISKIEVFGTEGKLYYTAFDREKIDLSNLNKGIYILKAETSSKKNLRTKICIY